MSNYRDSSMAIQPMGDLLDDCAEEEEQEEEEQEQEQEEEEEQERPLLSEEDLPLKNYKILLKEDYTAKE